MDSLPSFESSSSSVSHSSSADIEIFGSFTYTPNINKLECYFSSVYEGLLQMAQNQDRACKREPRRGISVRLFWKVRLGCQEQFLQCPWVLSNLLFDSITTSQQEVMVKQEFLAMMCGFGLADIKHIIILLFRMMDRRREGRINREDMKTFLRRVLTCLEPTWLQSYKQAAMAIESTVLQYFVQTVVLDLQSFNQRCFRTSNDPFLEITTYLSKKLDIEGRLYRFECEAEFKRSLKSSQLLGVQQFLFTIQGALSSKLIKFKEQAQYMNQGSSSSQQTTCSLFSGSSPLSQQGIQTSPYPIFYKGVLLQKVIKDNQPSLISCNFELRGQELYMTHVEKQEVDGAVMFLIATRAVLLDRGLEIVGMQEVHRFDIIYGSQSKTFFSPSVEQHSRWIAAFSYIMKKPSWVGEDRKEEEENGFLEQGIRIERIEKEALSESEEQRVRIQLDLLMLSRHRHIVPLLDYYELPDCFLLARPAHQQLQTVAQYANSKGGLLPETEVKVIISQIATALFYLKDLGIFHGDIRPENIQVLRTAERGLHVGIGGHFEAAMLVSAGVEVLGELKYMAPQLLHIRSTFPFAGDVYSLGVTAYELLSGVFPFDECSRSKLLQEVLRRQPTFKKDFSKKSISSDAISFCKQMMVKDPKKRLSIQEVLSHKWLCGGSLRKARLNPSGRNHYGLFALG